MDAMKKLLEKKKKEGHMLDPMEKDAKMSVLHDLHNEASDMMKHQLGGLKKVSVSADSPEHLEKGLETAKGLVHEHEAEQAEDGHDPDMEELEEETGEDLDHDNEEGEPLEHQLAMGHESSDEDEEPMSEEELDAKLAKLMKMKAMMQKG